MTRKKTFYKWKTNTDKNNDPKVYQSKSSKTLQTSNAHLYLHTLHYQAVKYVWNSTLYHYIYICILCSILFSFFYLWRTWKFEKANIHIFPLDIIKNFLLNSRVLIKYNNFVKSFYRVQTNGYFGGFYLFYFESLCF